MTLTISVAALAALDAAFFMWAVGQSQLLDDARVEVAEHRDRIDNLTADLYETNRRIDSLTVPAPKPTPFVRVPSDTRESAVVITDALERVTEPVARGRHAAP